MQARYGYPLPRRPESVRHARIWVRISLMGRGCDDAIDPALLIMSELASNADAPRGALLYPRCSRGN
jgi:hypothetical protein